MAKSFFKKLFNIGSANKLDIKQILAQKGITPEYILNLVNKKEEMTEEEMKIHLDVLASLPKVKKGTKIQKVVDAHAVDWLFKVSERQSFRARINNLLKRRVKEKAEKQLELRGFVAQAQDVSDLDSFPKAYKGLALNYSGSTHFGKTMAFAISYETEKPENYKRPLNSRMYKFAETMFPGAIKIFKELNLPSPYGGNAYTVSKDGLFPELIADPEKMNKTAVVHLLTKHGKKRVAKYSESDGKFVIDAKTYQEIMEWYRKQPPDFKSTQVKREKVKKHRQTRGGKKYDIPKKFQYSSTGRKYVSPPNQKKSFMQKFKNGIGSKLKPFANIGGKARNILPSVKNLKNDLFNYAKLTIENLIPAEKDQNDSDIGGFTDIDPMLPTGGCDCQCNCCCCDGQADGTSEKSEHDKKQKQKRKRKGRKGKGKNKKQPPTGRGGKPNQPNNSKKIQKSITQQPKSTGRDTSPKPKESVMNKVKTRLGGVGKTIGNLFGKAKNWLPSGKTVGNLFGKAKDWLPSGETVGNLLGKTKGWLPSGETVGNLIGKAKSWLPSGATIKNFGKGALKKLPLIGTVIGAGSVLTSDNKLDALLRLGAETVGGVLGGAAGAALGSIVPGPGTAIGGVAGTALGSAGGGYLYDKAKQWLTGKSNQNHPSFRGPVNPARVIPKVNAEQVSQPIKPVAPTKPTKGQNKLTSLTVQSMPITLKADGVLQDVSGMMRLLRDPSISNEIKRIIEKAFVDAYETKGGATQGGVIV
ncbi:hypothetical protein [Brevibacillus sp. SYSU BS000544]|uniref:hypothetical protein n=1 Tax=Brevibacillus sp. SYSU BS000544 TaxID=3416443 RepID=UPI003CE48819